MFHLSTRGLFANNKTQRKKEPFENDDWAAGRLTVDVYEQKTQLTILPCK